MAITILQLAAKVSADTSEAEAGLKRVRSEADNASGAKDGGGVGGLIKSIAGIAGGILTASAVSTGFDFLKSQLGDTITAANNLQLVQAQTQAAIKSTGDASGMTAQQIGALADKLSTVTPFSKEATQSAENMLLTFTNIKGNLPGVTQTTLDFATAMHMDATSAALQLGKALNDPATGYSKLQREGVTFTKSQIDSMKAMEKNGNIAGAQAIMLQELQKEFGGSAKAAGGTFAGALTIAQNSLDDTKAKIGAALIPVLSKLLVAIQPIVGTLLNGLNIVLPIVTGLFSDLMTAIQPLLDNIPSLTGAVGGDLTGAFTTVMPYVKQLGQIFTQSIIPIFKQAWTIIQTDVLPIMKQLGQLFLTNIIPAVSSVAQWVNIHLMPAIKQFSDFVKANVMPVVKTLVTVFMTDVLPTVEKVGTVIIDKLLPPLEKLMSKILPVVNVLLQVAGFLFKNVVGPAISGAVTIVGGLVDTISGLIGIIGNLFTWFGQVGGQIGQVMGHFGDLNNLINGAVNGAINGIGTAFSTVFGGLWDVVKAPLNLIIGGINALIGGLDSIHFKIPDWSPIAGGKSFGINIPKIPTLATGGTAVTAGDVIVGEQGPEMLHMPQGASIIPLGGGGLNGAGVGGASGPITINITTRLDGRVLAQQVVQHIPAAVRTATGARAF